MNVDLDAVVCGPDRISQAHQPNECISVSSLVECEAFLYCLISNLTDAK